MRAHATHHVRTELRALEEYDMLRGLVQLVGDYSGMADQLVRLQEQLRRVTARNESNA